LSKRGQWKLPTIEFLRRPPKVESSIDRERLIQNSQILRQKFLDFGIDGEVTAVRPGPVITLYEFKPGPGVKVSRIAALADDLSMALSAQSVRILAPLPGKSVVGIEIPSDSRETVYMREFLQHPDFYGQKHSIPVVMGKDIGGQTVLSDLARMPHLLCAGQTGAGKSVFMNGLICSLLYRFTPDEMRMILVDPKFIEFRSYQDIPHLLLPVVDDPNQAGTALKWAVREMERRYKILAKLGARNLASFNQKVDEMGAEVVRDLLLAEENQEEDESPNARPGNAQDWMEAFEPDESGAPRVGKLPYVVIIIDELADLMMVSKKEVEISIARIAQKARAAGLHLVIATQRPSTDVVTGLIKANLPSRVSFQLASFVDSKTILDRAGAERLLGQGDMLFIPPGISQTVRLHGAFVDDDEIAKITGFLKSQGKPAYRDEILLASDDDENESGEDGESSDDDLFQEAVELVKHSGHASASFLQRHLKVGYNRAARMIETMESRGIVGPADGARPREVLIR
jgi:S-DNA-T family DNA segregation ATPase FtsK/SpoIIIE